MRPPGICVNLEEDGIVLGKHLKVSMWDVHAGAFIISSIVLISWARRKYNEESSGFFSSDKLVIFPIHLDLLILIGITAFIQGIYTAIFEAEEIDEGFGRAIGDGICFGMSHVVIEGTTFLLLSAGIGKKAMKRAAFGGFVIGIIIGFFKFTSSLEDEEISFDNIPTNIMVFMGDACYLIWLSTFSLFYLIIWLAPNKGYMTRRAGAIVWARFWFIYNILLLLSEIMEELKIYACFCLYHFTIFFGFALLKGWIAYHAFVLEALWWHGADVSGKTCYMIDCEKGGRLRTKSSLKNTNERESETLQSQEAISSPFGGLELSTKSAAAISDAIDGFGRARGDSLSRDDPQVKEQRKSNKISNFFSGSSKKNKNGVLPSVPLIDFTRLKIIPNRLLGVGSTARVYEGRWCGRKVAVKVLFTVEIVPDEIRRTCREASLLHSLNSTSEHVIRLFGVAVLPPSICVVLDLCSEGSLSDVLYNMEEVVRPSSSSSLNPFRMATGGELRASSGWSFSSGGSGHSLTSSDVSTMSKSLGLPDFVYRLTWAQLIDLALGTAKGVAALVKAMPGYSHNDIKSANFLVDKPEGGETYVVKIADMEFASEGVTPDYMLRGDTPNWCAPEILKKEADVSPASDVYALANVMYEIAARRRPFDGEEASQVLTFIKEGKRPEFREWECLDVSLSGDGGRASAAAYEVESRDLFKSLVMRSWAQDPNDRPTAAEIVGELEMMKEEYLLKVSSLRAEHKLSGLRNSSKASKAMLLSNSGSSHTSSTRPLVDRDTSSSANQTTSPVSSVLPPSNNGQAALITGPSFKGTDEGQYI